MDRWACVNVFALPLQLMLGRHAEWKELPAAVVDQDRPQGAILWINRYARERRLREGMRYAEALSLVPQLRVDVVGADEIALAVTTIADCLQRFSPGVEPFEDEAGIFWLNASGLLGLYGSLEAWAASIKQALDSSLGLYASVVVGFSRFGSFAVARAYRKTGVFEEPEHELQAARGVHLALLATSDFAIEPFERLGVRTMGDFLALPAAGIRRRFGAHALRLHRLAAGSLVAPLKPYQSEQPTEQARALDDAEQSTTRLLFLIKQLVHPLCLALDARGEQVVELCLRFVLDHAPSIEESVRPAEATLDEAVLIELVRLRLETMVFAAGVIELNVIARGLRASVEQLGIFVEAARRDLGAANRAFARIRAEFGDHAVVHLRLREGHLPEARFEWVPLQKLVAARAQPTPLRPLMRRLFPIPLAMATHSLAHFDHHAGPHIISGGWWVREVQRDYHFVEKPDGSLLWIYHDRRRDQWFIHAEVR
ncbi:MAG: DNA polymerase Y family protein [Bradymonadaceae bacterium]|nr:DNA polymerase Y family protein [Lujinxingiaceae bacterium]